MRGLNDWNLGHGQITSATSHNEANHKHRRQGQEQETARGSKVNAIIFEGHLLCLSESASFMISMAVGGGYAKLDSCLFFLLLLVVVKETSMHIHPSHRPIDAGMDRGVSSRRASRDGRFNLRPILFTS